MLALATLAPARRRPPLRSRATYRKNGTPPTKSGPRLPDGRILAYNYKERRNELYDERTGEVTPLKGVRTLRPIGEITGESFLALHDGKRIVRYHIETGEIEKVWPR